MSNIQYDIWLSACEGVNAQLANELLEYFGSSCEIYNAGRSDIKHVARLSSRAAEGLGNKDLSTADRIINSCKAAGCSILTISDALYPGKLRNIYDPPVVLYIKGHLPPVDDIPVIGIVGTRQCTPYGYKNTEKTALALSKHGITVTTGLARGIDTAAATGGLGGKMPVIGVIGCGIDIVFPRQNRALFDKVASNGAIVSEYPPGMEARVDFFPARNRIISGLSNGVAVIEAPQRSGALITAGRALEQGRDVFVLPGNVDSYACIGSNNLLRQGAIPFITADDIIDEYKDLYPIIQKPFDNKDMVDYIDLSKLNTAEKTIIGVLGARTMYADEIITGSGLNAPAALAALTGLELSGYIKREGTNHYTLTH